MDLCSDGHDEIAFDDCGRQECPVCSAMPGTGIVDRIEKVGEELAADLRALASQIKRREEALRVPNHGNSRRMSLLDTCEHVTSCLEELGEQISSGRFDAAKDWAKHSCGVVVKNAREVTARARG